MIIEYNIQYKSRSSLLAEIVEHVGLGLKLPSIGPIIPQPQIELLGLFDSQPALQHLNALHKVIPIVFKVTPILGFLQVLEFCDVLELREVLLALLQYQLIQLILFLELIWGLFVCVYSRV